MWVCVCVYFWKMYVTNCNYPKSQEVSQENKNNKGKRNTLQQIDWKCEAEDRNIQLVLRRSSEQCENHRW